MIWRTDKPTAKKIFATVGRHKTPEILHYVKSIDGYRTEYGWDIETFKIKKWVSLEEDEFPRMETEISSSVYSTNQEKRDAFIAGAKWLYNKLNGKTSISWN